MTRILSLITLFAILATPAAAAAQAPSGTTRLVPVSGVLTDTSGAALAGAQTVTFAVFDVSEGGAALWTETQEVLADDRGRYSAHLGRVVRLPLEIFRTEQARWLDVSAGGASLPRVMLVAVPYALKAADAETLAGTPLSSFVLTGPDGRLRRADGAMVDGPAVDGTGVANQLAKWNSSTTLSSSIVTESGLNQLGIGTTDPTEGGVLDSKVTIRTNDGSTALAVANQAGTPRFALNVNSDGSWITYDRATGVFQPGIAQRGGRVGIATTDPTGGGVVDAKFTVRNLDNNTGIAVLNEANARRFALNTLTNGGWTLYDGGSGVWNPGLTQGNGRVQLGTTTPFGTERLTVSGGALRGMWARTTADFGIVGDTAVAGDTGGTAVIGQAGTGRGVWAFSSSGFALYVSGNGTVQAAFVGTGNVGIGTASPADKLDVDGDIRVGTGATGCVKDGDATVIAGTCSSDLRFKKNITPFGRALDNVARLQPMYFNWRADEFPERHLGNTRSFGLIAQEVEQVLPELVTTDDDGYKAVKYNQLPFHLLQAIKDLKSENEALKHQLKAQEDRLRRLEAVAAK